MQYKGLKMMKRAAALVISAALMLTDIGVTDVSAAQHETTKEKSSAVIANKTWSSLTTESSSSEFSSSVESSESESSSSTERVETESSSSTERIETESSSSTERVETESSSSTERIETESSSSVERTETESSPTVDRTGESEASVNSSTDSSAPDRQLPEVTFKRCDNNNTTDITDNPFKIAVNKPVTIEAAVSGNMPMNAIVSVQWDSSRPDYVSVVGSEKKAELIGLKSTADLDENVQITCFIEYKENGKTKYTSGVLNAAVNPLANSISIRLGTDDVTGKKVVYDLDNKQFIAIGDRKLKVPVKKFTVIVYPSGARQDVIWKSSDESFMKFADEKDGEVKAQGVGEAVVTASATNGNDVLSADAVTGSVTVKTRRIVDNISFTAKMKDSKGTELKQDDQGRYEITSGASIYLEPKYTPADPTEKKIAWTNGNKDAVDIKADANNGLIVTAKNVTGETDVTLTAKATDMGEAEREVKLVVKPKVKTIRICKKGTNENLSGGSIGIDLDGTESYILEAVNVPEYASRKVEWSNNDKNNVVADYEVLPDNTYKITAKAKGTAVITASALDGSGVKATTTLNVMPLVKSVNIEGSSMVMQGKTIRLTASTRPLSIENVKVKWWTSTPSTVQVNPNTGDVKGLKRGNAVIFATAQDGSGKEDKHQVRVTDPIKKVDIINGSTVNGEREIVTGKTVSIDPDSGKPKYTADIMISPEGACQEVEWKSGNEKIATVEIVDNKAVIKAKAFGKTTITAKAVDGSGKTASMTVNVSTLAKSVTVTGNHYLAKGKSLQLKAEVGNRDAANKSVVWTSSAPNVAKVDKSGRVTAVSVGSADITAEAADGSGVKSLPHRVSVVDGKCAVDITSLNDKTRTKNITNDVISPLEDGTMDIDFSGEQPLEIYFRASLKGYTLDGDVPLNVQWSTSSKAIATVEADKDDSSIGRVTIYKGGTVKITATSAEGYKSSKSVTIKIKNDNPYIKITGANHRLSSGKSMKLSVGGVPVEWTSGKESIATVDRGGTVRALKNQTGTVTITATAVDVPADKPNFDTYEIVVGQAAESVQLALSYTDKVDNGAIKTESLAKDARIGVDINDGYKGSRELKFAAKLNFSGGTSEENSTNVTWKSSNSGVAAIDAEGNVELKKTGTVTFTATATDGSNKSARATFVIDRQLTNISSVGDSTVYVGQNKSLQLRLNYEPLAAAKRKVVWTSSDSTAVSVNGSGRITGKRAGASATITAMAADNNSVQCEFKVNVEQPVSKVAIAAVRKDRSEAADSVYGIDLGGFDLEGKAVSPTLELKANLSKKIDKNTETPCTSQSVTWSSSNTKVATVDEKGVVTGLKNGTVTITATAADGSGTRGKATVYCGNLIKSITSKGTKNIFSENENIVLVRTNRFKNTFTLADKIDIKPLAATNRNLTYTSDNKAVAVVDSKGKITAKKEGEAFVTIAPKDGSGVVNRTIKQIKVTVVER